jgi:pimeloyl-ACP methyl ester carboxylesterase
MDAVRSADGTTIAFESSGHGPALVLVTGAFCDRTSPAGLAAALGPDFTVYSYDRRGRGDSGDQPPYAIAREVEDLAAVVAAAGGGGPVSVFGHSSGAALALEAAASGVPMTALAVYEPPYAGDGPSAAFAAELGALVTGGQRGAAAAAFLQLTGVPAQAVAGMRSSPYWPRMEALAHTLPYDITLCNGGAVPADRLAGLQVPVLALAGGESGDWARKAAAEIAAVTAGGRDQVLDGQGHVAADEVLAPVLTGFYAGGRPASAS